MSGPVGRVTAALATVVNENVASLATLNFDFTMVKMEAPAEYHGLTSAISKNRRLEAEEGTLHRTARKLGALFEQVLPKTPALFRAYGTRVSEISNSFAATSREPRGIFASQMGVDSGTIWAAVTSGTGAIAVHLLGCMLARIFTGTEATSIWVELVEKQKEQIRDGCKEDLYQQNHTAAMLAAQQDFPREDLANWDASARAWLQSADLAKALQHKQLMLILENACIPVNTETNTGTYEGVMKAWTTALVALDSLIRGQPQQVQDGAALLAISSWHIYPDISVIGKTCVEIQQHDPIFGPLAVLSLGLQSKEDRSVSWSLPLARLQYYGHPVHTSRTAGHDNTRISPTQLSYVVLGSLFAAWGDYADTLDKGLAWLEDISQMVESQKRTILQEPSYVWLYYLRNAARTANNCTGIEKKLALQLMALGRRWPQFLYGERGYPLPLFGLCDLKIILLLVRSQESQLALLRAVASKSTQQTPNFFIRYRPQGTTRYIYASVPTVNPESEVENAKSSEVPKYSCLGTRWITLHSVAELKNMCTDLEGFLANNPDLYQMHESISGSGERCLVAIDFDKEVFFGYGDHIRMAAEDIWKKLRKHVSSGLVEMMAAEDLRKKLREHDSSGLIEMRFYGGGRAGMAIYSSRTHRIKPLPKNRLTPHLLRTTFAIELADPETIFNYLVLSTDYEIEALRRCAAVAEIYKELPNATISTLVLSQSISDASWARDCKTDGFGLILSRPQTFACIAMFDTGICDLDPRSVEEVFAMSIGNSIYVASALLCDPWEVPKANEVKRVLGNIGRAGISLLISPRDLKIREAQIENWRQINHIPFIGDLEDCFKSTSVHLSFTAYEMPLRTNTNDRHVIDRSVRLIETLTSVYDQGNWIADIDILRALGTDSAQKKSQTNRATCHFSQNSPYSGLAAECENKKLKYEEVSATCSQLSATSIDNWDELLDPPDSGTMAIRANKNWLARLALTAVCDKLGFTIVLLPEEPCWSCCGKLLLKERENWTVRHRLARLNKGKQASDDSDYEVSESESCSSSFADRLTSFKLGEQISGSDELASDSASSSVCSDSPDEVREHDGAASNLDFYGSERQNRIVLLC